MILHVIRDCPAMRGIWERFVPAAKRHIFFSMLLFQWLYKNMSDNGVGSGIDQLENETSLGRRVVLNSPRRF